MSSIEKVDELLQAFNKELPTLESGKNLIEKYAILIDNNIILSEFENKLTESYKQFENWLNGLFGQEKIPDNIIAFNFGLYESDKGIQLYISGSTEWDFEDEDWSSNNDYFPECRYPEIAVYKDFYPLWEDKFYLGLFLTISTTIIYANTYLLSNPSKFPQSVVLATGFDDGDLYNFCKKSDKNIISLLN